MPDHWPTEAGWYWVRTRIKGRPWGDWRVVKVLDGPIHPFLPRPHLDTEWNGPIEPPS